MQKDDLNKEVFSRVVRAELDRAFSKPFVHILFGARQTGKSSMIRHLVPDPSLSYDFSDPTEKAESGMRIAECGVRKGETGKGGRRYAKLFSSI